LGGDLDVSLISGFVPAAGNTFTILTANLIGDTFDDIHLPLLSPGLVWDYAQTLTSISLSVAAADFNRDGVVDTADYILWSKTKNTTGGVPYAGADGNGDGTINDLDLAIWQNNFGNTRGGSGGGAGGLTSSGVPEPTSVALLLLSLPFALRRGNSFAFRGRKVA
jgi:hypothetical protein